MGDYATHTLEWSSFGYSTPIQGDEGLTSSDTPILPEGDRICITEEDGAIYKVAPFELQVVLNVAEGQELKAMTKEGQTYSSIPVLQNQHGPQSMLLQVHPGKFWYSTVFGGHNPFQLSTVLVFCKITPAGLPTPLYELHNLQEKAGKSIVFRWESN